jgi:NAD(P)-dependent dehydrogenase (short-subunit alcohol dehydrogenase family)
MTALRFTGTTAVVTGAGGGIGKQIAQDLLDAGINVCGLDLKESPEFDISGDANLVFKQTDITDAEAVSAAIDEARGAVGSVDYVACAAGVAFIGKDAGIVDVAPGILDTTLDVNLGGVINVVKACIDDLRESPVGAIVNIASIAGLRGAENIEGGDALDAYQLSKAAVVSLSKSIALQYAKDGVRCNTVCPGAIWTPMTDAIYQDPQRVESMAERTPIKRVGTPDDISYATMFLLADQASFITGIDLISDGGIMARL